MTLWRWSVIVFVSLSGCATNLPQGPVTTPVPTTRPLAWVLWAEHQYPGLPASAWSIYRVYERLNECEAETYATAKDASEHLPNVRERIGSTVVFTTPDGDARTRHLCLPDTMDPRR
jgi:hypothetical protein